MVDDLNLTMHTYNEVLAIEIHKRLPGHVVLLRQWLEGMKIRVEQNKD